MTRKLITITLRCLINVQMTEEITMCYCEGMQCGMENEIKNERTTPTALFIVEKLV